MLRVKNLSLNLPTDQSLNDISFSVNNSTTVVVGDNNSGKSLLLKVIANCDTNHDGQITLNHFKAESENEKAKLLLSFSPEIPDIPMQLTAMEYLEMVANIYALSSSERTSAINDLSEILSIKEFLHTTIEHLSIDQRKKVSLVAAFLADRPILLLDNPTLFQDYQSQKAIYNLITSRSNHCSMLIATNDLDFAQEIADNYLIMKAGEIIASGTLEELAAQTQSKKSLKTIYERILE